MNSRWNELPIGVQHHLSETEGPAVAVLSEILQDSDRAQFLIELGSLYHKGQRVLSPNQKIEIGDLLRVHTTPRRFELPSNSEMSLVYEHKDFLVLNKPAFLPVHPTVDNSKENLVAWLSAQRGENLYVTHRLDVGTTGLIVFARNKEFQKTFNKMLSLGVVQKNYRTVVKGDWTKLGDLTHYMEVSDRAPKKLFPDNASGAHQLCLLEVMNSEKHGDYSLLTLKLKTGRTHQIRAQLAYEGFPILGDVLYGAEYPENSKRDHFLLQACELKFTVDAQELRFSLDREVFEKLLSHWVL